MRIGYFVVLAFLWASPGRADTGFLDRKVMLNGQTYAYQVYVPADYTSAKAWPVIVNLHGNGSQGTDALLPTVRGVADEIRQHRDRFPVIAVMPQCEMGKRWLYPDMEELVMKELDATVREFHVDPARIYLTGFSMGATGAYRIAAKWPERFAALLAVAGRVEPASTYSPQDIQADQKANTFVAAADPFAALALRIKTLPMWIAHGDADETVPVEQSRRLVPALKKTGADVRYTEIAGASHVGGADKTYGDRAVFEWLLAQRRAPKGSQ